MFDEVIFLYYPPVLGFLSIYPKNNDVAYFSFKNRIFGWGWGKGVSVAVWRSRDENMVFVLHPQDYSPDRIICAA